ncbi:unnamed protein product [Linum tenue]|uniref:SWIM-type domain-containing protein n=1 Tax=Linum tenue TaxID=586396 RepID=A0AAV0MHH3_9ROSI|nr:unnamed protein product [Linum tenue]
MARWDEILSLPVQNPPTLDFSAGDLVWSKVEGWRDNLDRLALIPYARVDDFVRGESANKDCPTRFHVEARRRRPPQASCKQKVDGILEYILYWCSFGPDDHRKGGIVRPSRNTYVPKKKNAGRPNTKRGCTCHFIVKRLIAEPTVALVIYNQDKHIDKMGLPCHGPQDKKAEGTRAMFAPYISEDLRLRVWSLLYVGVSVETIMQRHNESVEKQGGPSNRDHLLTHRYVRRQERSMRRSTYQLDEDDAVSIGLWVESHQSHVFFYEDFSDTDPLVLGIQTEWQLQQMIRFGNKRLMASDSSFGPNKLKHPVQTLLVFNSENKAIPVAWIITPRFASTAHKWMRPLYNRVRSKDPNWMLAGFIVDDPSMDILTIRDVFQCSVLLSFWRVRHSWHKNLVKRCTETERVQISQQLGLIVDKIRTGPLNIGLWTTALRTIPLASQETGAALEFYHNQLKVRLLLNEKDSDVYQRADWLVDKLGTKVHSYFWLDEYSEKDYFARYWKDEWITGLTSWRKALKIPDSDVILEEGTSCVRVINQVDRDKVHLVRNSGSQFALCDCKWAEMGNLCEHVFKASKLILQKENRDLYPSTTVSQYIQALLEMLHCPTNDSLIRDHAVSLSVLVHKKLDSLVAPDSRSTPMDQLVLSKILQKRMMVGPGVAEQSSSGRETGCSAMDVDLSSPSRCMGHCEETHDVLGDVSCNIVDGRIERLCNGMDLDSSPPTSTSPRLHSSDEASNNGNSSNSKEIARSNMKPIAGETRDSEVDISTDVICGEQEDSPVKLKPVSDDNLQLQLNLPTVVATEEVNSYEKFPSAHEPLFTTAVTKGDVAGTASPSIK